MKDLLQFLQKRLSEEIENQDSPGYTNLNSKLEYIYEDLLSKTNDALEELSGGEINFDTGTSTGDIDFRGGGITADKTNGNAEDSFQSYQRQAQAQVDDFRIPDAFDGTREEFAEFAENFKNLTGREIPDQWNSSQEILTEQEKNQPNKDEHHAQRDGSKESFEDLKKKVESFTATDLDPDRLRELADVAEQFDEGSSVDPRDMSDDEFGKLLSRLRPNLVDWAAGKKEDFVEKLDQSEIANEIRNAIHRAQQESDGNIDMLRSFQEHVSDSIFDTSRNMDDGYAPEYEDVKPGDRLDIDEDEIRDPREENIHPNNVRDPKKP
jgi:hypothetical protein